MSLCRQQRRRQPRRREETTMECYWRRNNRQCNLNCILISVIDPAIRVCDKSMCFYVFCSRFEFHIVVAQKWVRRLIDNRNFRLHNELNKEKKSTNELTNYQRKSIFYFLSLEIAQYNIGPNFISTFTLYYFSCCLEFEMFNFKQKNAVELLVCSCKINIKLYLITFDAEKIHLTSSAFSAHSKQQRKKI